MYLRFLFGGSVAASIERTRGARPGVRADGGGELARAAIDDSEDGRGLGCVGQEDIR